MKAVREEGLATNAVAGETSYSLKRRTGVTGGREREVSRQTQRADSVSCFLSPGGNRAAHTPLGLPHLMIPLSGHGYIQSPKC